jgi:hypothetical protein
MMMKEIKKEEKYLVLKLEDLDEYFNQFTKGIFATKDEQKIIDNLTWKEVIREIKNNNKYIVCNQDEPYAEKVWQVILDGERDKVRVGGK